MPTWNQLPDGGNWLNRSQTPLSTSSSSLGSTKATVQHHSPLPSRHSSSSSDSASAAERQIKEKQELNRHLPPEDRVALTTSKPSKGGQSQPPSHSANHQKHPSKPSGTMSPNAMEHRSSSANSSKPASKVSGTMSPNAMEHRSSSANSSKPASKVSGTMSPNAMEHRSSSANSSKPASKVSGTMSPNAMEHRSNLASHSKPASKVSGTMSPNAIEHRSGSKHSKLPGIMSADGAEHWSNPTSIKKPASKVSGTMSPNAIEHGSGSQHFSIKPKPIFGSAADLAEAGKELQQRRDAEQSLRKSNKGGIFGAELRDLQRDTSVAQARVDASEAAKKLQDFPTQARRLPSNNRGITEEIRSDLAQQANSAKEKYMGTQGLDVSGQPIKLIPPPPAPEPPKPEPEKSLLDRGKDFLGGYVNFQKDVDIGAAKAVWDMGKGLGSLAKSGVEFQRDVYTNPEKARQTLINFSGNLQEIAKHPGQVWDALKQPYVDAINSGHPGEAIGRGFVDIGSLFVPGGAIGKAGEGANVLSKVSKVGDVTNTLSKVDKAGITVSRATNVADESVKGVASIGKKYTFDTTSIGATPGKPLTFGQRKKTWRAMAEDPEAPLTDAQREQIRNTPKSISPAPTWDNPVTGQKEIMDLSHEGKSFSENVESGSARREHGTEVVPRWRETHVHIDKFRGLRKTAKDGYTSEKEAYTSSDGIDKIRKAFAEKVKEWGYNVDDSKL